MRLILPLLLTVLSANAQWQLLRYFTTYPTFDPTNAPAEANAIAGFTFPPSSQGKLFPAFLTHTQVTTMNLSGSVMRAEFSVTATPDAVFRFGGQGTWNPGTAPPNTRLYFSVEPHYYNEGPHSNYWFSKSGAVFITNGFNTAVMSASITNPAQWSDGQGQSVPEQFWWAASRVKSVGICFGGGSFYDIGIAMVTGTAEFHLYSFDCNPPFRVEIVGGYTGNNYGFFYSTNLVNWTNEPPSPSPRLFVRGAKL